MCKQTIKVLPMEELCEPKDAHSQFQKILHQKEKNSKATVSLQTKQEERMDKQIAAKFFSFPKYSLFQCRIFYIHQITLIIKKVYSFNLLLKVRYININSIRQIIPCSYSWLSARNQLCFTLMEVHFMISFKRWRDNPSEDPSKQLPVYLQSDN